MPTRHYRRFPASRESIQDRALLQARELEKREAAQADPYEESLKREAERERVPYEFLLPESSPVLHLATRVKGDEAWHGAELQGTWVGQVKSQDGHHLILELEPTKFYYGSTAPRLLRTLDEVSDPEPPARGELERSP